MHDYLRSVGFANIKTKKEEDDLIKEVLKHPTERYLTETDGITFAEFRREYGAFTGVAVRGEFDSDNKFHVHYYYPYFQGSGMTSREKIEFEKHSDKMAYAGIIDDIRVGSSLIFYLQNLIPYLRMKKMGKKVEGVREIKLSGLSTKGTVLLPVYKRLQMENNNPSGPSNRTRLIAAAREGDEEAIESLTLEDIDLYSMISKRVMTEDILSIVESTFMPSGIESDEYYLIGEIIDLEEETNPDTDEKIYQLTLNCNDIFFDICINEEDLMGEPKIGRRFRGGVWLQGEVDFEE
jgi:hypothetical protein